MAQKCQCQRFRKSQYICPRRCLSGIFMLLLICPLRCVTFCCADSCYCYFDLFSGNSSNFPKIARPKYYFRFRSGRRGVRFRIIVQCLQCYIVCNVCIIIIIFLWPKNNIKDFMLLEMPTRRIKASFLCGTIFFLCY